MNDRPDLRGADRQDQRKRGSGKLYLDKFNGKFLGVCSGFADYIGAEAIWIRLGFVLLVIFTPASALLVPAYFILALCVPNKPPHLYRDDYKEVFGGERDEFTRTKRREDEL